jgi:cell wall-associated NlpC family hydrolase
MTTQKHVPQRLTRAGAVSVLTVAALGGTLIAPGPAEAASLGDRAVRIAASKEGSPYRWGAAGPYRFDCSGLTRYAYKRAGKRLPRTAAGQYNRTRRVSSRYRTRGDLVFFHSSRGIYHVGIYAGRGRLWHAPKSGDVVRLDRIYGSRVSYGRVR